MIDSYNQWACSNKIDCGWTSVDREDLDIQPQSLHCPKCSCLAHLEQLHKDPDEDRIRYELGLGPKSK